MKCKICGDYVSSLRNRGDHQNPVCVSCAEKIVKQYAHQQANVSGYGHTVTQHMGDIHNHGGSGCIYGGFPSLQKCDGAFGAGCQYQFQCPIYHNYLDHLGD